MTNPVLGLDIGGTKLAAGLVTPDGVVHEMLVEPTRSTDGWPVITRRLVDLGRRSLQAAGVADVEAVGISCGGPLDAPAGVLISPPHLPGWIDVPIGRIVSDAFSARAVLENDASAAALAEFRFGAARGARTMIYLTISTGIGGGVVIDGRLHRGSTGNGGELGHVLVQTGGRLCICGRHGCLEAHCSGTNIAARAREAVAAAARTGELTALAAIDNVTAADVAAATRDGDVLAARIWDETVTLLGSGLVDIINVVEPDIAVLGGGVTRSGDLLLEPVRQMVKAQVLGPAADHVQVNLAGLGDAVGVVGAAAVAWDLAPAQ